MPAMVACGRRWPIGSDDLVFPGIASLVIRMIVILTLVFALIAYRDSFSCTNTPEVVSVIFAMLALGVIIVILEVLVVVFSARGSIVNSKPRWPVVYLLYIRMGLFCLETVLTIVGTAFAFADEVTSANINIPECSDLSGPFTALRVLMVLLCLVLIGIIIGILLYVDPCRVYRSKDHYDPRFTDESIFSPQQGTIRIPDAPRDLWQNHHKTSHAFWEKAFRFLFCACNSKIEHRSYYSELASLFSRGFCDVNVVPSDIAALFILLQRHQLAEERNRRLYWQDMDEDVIRKLLPKFSDSTEYFCKPVDLGKKEDFETFEAAKYYIKYANATYTWLGYLYFGESCSCCKLCLRVLKEGCCFQRRREYIHRDNCCNCALHGFTGLVGDLLEDDIIYFSLENGICQVPFYVVFDRERRAVVVAIRGTLSMSDVVTDLFSYAEPILISSSTEGKAHFAHKGMLQTAMWVKERLYVERILERAFSLEPDYNFILTGVSLGGGCAALLSLLLKEDYPGLKCYTYGTPGTLLDINGAMYTQSFITAIAVGKDFIGRLSVYTAYLLKHDLLKLAFIYDKPKFQILLEGMVETLSRCIGKEYSFPVKSVDTPVGVGQSEVETGTISDAELNDRLNVKNMPHPPAVSPSFYPQADTPTSLGSNLLHPPASAASCQRASTLNSTVNTPDHDVQEERFTGIEVQVPCVEDSDEDDRTSVNSVLVPGCEEESAFGSSLRHEFTSIFQHRVPLFPPGKIIHLREVRQPGQCFLSKRRFEAHWVNNESFQRIIFHPDMLRDHLPTTIDSAMQCVWEEQAATHSL